MIIYFRDKNHKSKHKYQNYKTLKTDSKPKDSIVVIGATSISISLSITCLGLVIVPISTSIACGPTVGTKLICEIVMEKCSR